MMIKVEVLFEKNLPFGISEIWFRTANCESCDTQGTVSLGLVSVSLVGCSVG